MTKYRIYLHGLTKKKAWSEYKKIFVTEKRINGGIQFYKKNKDRLVKAAARDNGGVDPIIVLSIIHEYVSDVVSEHVSALKNGRVTDVKETTSQT